MPSAAVAPIVLNVSPNRGRQTQNANFQSRTERTLNGIDCHANNGILKMDRADLLRSVSARVYSYINCNPETFSRQTMGSRAKYQEFQGKPLYPSEAAMNSDSAIGVVAILTETAVIGLLIYRRVWRTLPVFFAYCVWALVSDGAAYGIKIFSQAGYGFNFYAQETVLDDSLQFCVLVELAWSVLRPLRANLSRMALFAVAAAVLAVGAAIWPFAGIAGLELPRDWRLLVQLQQTVSILRIVFFLVLAGCCHFLSMNWRSRELQVATGFGFYSFVSVAVAALNTHQSTGLQFAHLYRIVVVGFLCSLLYWVFSFAQKEAARQEFTPQMQSTLMALAKSAHLIRQSLGDLAVAKTQTPDA
jgi:hypothetical protein